MRRVRRGVVLARLLLLLLLSGIVDRDAQRRLRNRTAGDGDGDDRPTPRPRSSSSSSSSSAQLTYRRHRTERETRSATLALVGRDGRRPLGSGQQFVLGPGRVEPERGTVP